MSAPDVNAWIEDVKAQPDSDRIGMMLIHRGVVRGTTRAGEPVSAMTLTYDADLLARFVAEAGAHGRASSPRGPGSTRDCSQ